MQSFGKYLIVIGSVIVVTGIVLAFFPKLNFFGKLPGDISFKGENFSFYFPLATCIILSIVLTLIFWIINRFFNR